MHALGNTVYLTLFSAAQHCSLATKQVVVCYLQNTRMTVTHTSTQRGCLARNAQPSPRRLGEGHHELKTVCRFGVQFACIDVHASVCFLRLLLCQCRCMRIHVCAYWIPSRLNNENNCASRLLRSTAQRIGSNAFRRGAPPYSESRAGLWNTY